MEIHLPEEKEAVTKETFTWRLRVEKYRAAEGRDGHYLLRTNLPRENPEVLWERYTQLTEIATEAVEPGVARATAAADPRVGHTALRTVSEIGVLGADLRRAIADL